MPVTVALTSDYSPIKRRGTLIMLMFCGNTLGGFLGGQLVAQILPIFGWQSIFLAGGIPPLLLIPILMAWLPELPRFLIAHRADAPATKEILRRLNVSAQAAASKLVDVAQGNPVAAAVHRRTCDTDHPAVGRVLRQPPEHVSVQLLDAHGADAVGARRLKTPCSTPACFQLGGILSTLLLGPMIDRFGAPKRARLQLRFGRGLHPAVGLATCRRPTSRFRFSAQVLR